LKGKIGMLDDTTRISDYIDEDFVLQTYNKLRGEIKKSKTDSKNFHYRELGVVLLKIGVHFNSEKVFKIAEEGISSLRSWDKAKAYWQIASFLNQINSTKYNVQAYYQKSFDHWKDSLLNKKEPLVNLKGSAIRFLEELNKENQVDLLKRAKEIYPEFIKQLPKEEQPQEWLKFAYQMINIIPNAEIHDILARADRLCKEQLFSSPHDLSRFLLEVELSKKLKDRERLSKVYSLFKDLNRGYDSLDGLVQLTGTLYLGEYSMFYKSELFARAFLEIGASDEALEIINSRVESILEIWEKHDKKGWIKDKVEKSFLLSEAINLGKLLVQYNLLGSCQNLIPLLSKKLHPDEVEVSFDDFQRKSLLVNLGAYPAEKIQKDEKKKINQINTLLLEIEGKKLDKTSFLMMRLSEALYILKRYENIVQEMNDNDLLVNLQQCMENVREKLQSLPAEKLESFKGMKSGLLGYFGKEKFLQITELIDNKNYSEVISLIRPYEEDLIKKSQQLDKNQYRRELQELIRLYLEVNNYYGAKRLIEELDRLTEEKVEPSETKVLPHFDMDYIIAKRNLFSLLALKISVYSKLNCLNVTEILEKIPKSDTSFAHHLGIVFIRNGMIEPAEKILSDTRVYSSSQDKLNISKYHLQRYQIYYALNDIQQAKLELDQAYQKKVLGYSYLEELYKYLKAYYILGEKEKSFEIIEEIFELFFKDRVVITGMRMTLPEFLFTSSQPMENSHKENLRKELQEYYQKQLKSLYTKSIRPGKSPLSFNGVIAFIRLLKNVGLGNKALELSLILLTTLDQLIKDEFPDYYTNNILKPLNTDKYQIWGTQIILQQFQRDPIGIPSALPITAIFNSPSVSSFTTEKEKVKSHYFKFAVGYKHLSSLFKDLELTNLMELCNTNSNKFFESLSLDMPMTTKFSDIEKYFYENKYSKAKELIKNVICELDGEKIRSWEYFLRYDQVLKLIEEKLAEERK